ncbi:Endonuclease/exonuclease/phosphatase, partial [Lenzites betulinus]
LASLNVNGFGRVTTGGASDKWLAVHQLMKEKRLTVLAVQEAHLTAERRLTLERLFGDKLAFYSSADPTSPLAVGGVAFVVSKRAIAAGPTSCVEIIPGKAAVLTIPWTTTRKLSLLNVYPPNRAVDNACFWRELDNVLRARGERPMILLGDFNFVELPEDRLPPRADSQTTVAAFTALRDRLALRDSWRGAHPTARVFTYCQHATGSQSRLDRIYVRHELATAAADWVIGPAGVVTDHFLVGLSLANYQAPTVGRGRWALPACMMEDPVFTATMRTLGMKLQDELSGIHVRSEECNPQRAFARFKARLRDAARERHK